MLVVAQKKLQRTISPFILARAKSKPEFLLDTHESASVNAVGEHLFWDPGDIPLRVRSAVATFDPQSRSHPF